MWVVCCAAFFGFLSCSEFTVPKAQDYDSNVHLAYADVAIDCKENPQILQFYVHQTVKNGPIQKGYEAIIRKNQLCSVPMSAILAYLDVRGTQPGHLSLTDRGNPLPDIISAQL